MASIKIEYDVWHIKNEIIDAIRHDGTREAKACIAKIKTKEAIINIMNFILSIACLILVFALAMLFACLFVHELWGEIGAGCGITLLIIFPICMVIIFGTEALKKSALNDAATHLLSINKRKK